MRICENYCAASLIQARISLGRIQKFYELEDLDDSNRVWINRSGISDTNHATNGTVTAAAGSVAVSNGVFTWSKTQSRTVNTPQSTASQRAQHQHTYRDSNRVRVNSALRRSGTYSQSSYGSTAIANTWINTNSGSMYELHLDFTAQTSELIAVVGSVATGKSALISAMLNDMTRISGSVTVNGSIAYVAQTAFICNMTLRDNILFGAHSDKDRYNAVLHACALTDDIALLPAGDLTEIGEKVSVLPLIQDILMSICTVFYRSNKLLLHTVSVP
jgi:ABC-type multidrug transport system fused ATPase/permease subunit